MCEVECKKLKCCYLNVCGLKKRLLSQDFNEILVENDICIFVETKLNDLDIPKLPNGYSYITKNRKNCKRVSGGIIVIYKTSLSNLLKFHDTESEFALWFQISKNMLSIESDILFGCIYIPPENSNYSTQEAFEEIENEMNILSKREKCYVSLIGDFNSKTGSLADFVIPDESIVRLFDLDGDSDMLNYMYDFEYLPQNGISLQRVSKCSCRPNNYGHKLLDMCKRNNLYIVNSRLGSDKGIGEKTCNDSSVVDYLILSSKLFTIVEIFSIDDFNPLFSDCHNPIKFSLLSSKTNHPPVNNRAEGRNSFRRWDNNKKTEYTNLVHSDPNDILTNVKDKLEEMSLSDISEITQSDINEIVTEIGKNFTNLANDTFGKISTGKKYFKHEDSKPWFNRKCSISRKKFHKARKRYSFLKNAENRRKMCAASKEHKATLNKAFTDYQQKAAKELRDISRKDPKALWKILNNLNNHQNHEQNEDISLQVL